MKHTGFSFSYCPIALISTLFDAFIKKVGDWMRNMNYTLLIVFMLTWTKAPSVSTLEEILQKTGNENEIKYYADLTLCCCFCICVS